MKPRRASPGPLFWWQWGEGIFFVGTPLSLWRQSGKCGRIKVLEAGCVDSTGEIRIFKILLSLQENLNAMTQIANGGILKIKDVKD